MTNDEVRHYNSFFGKKREIRPENVEESERRRSIFATLLPTIVSDLAAIGITDVEFKVVGSVRANAATEGSDLDLNVKGWNDTLFRERSVVLALIRDVVHSASLKVNCPFHISLIEPSIMQSALNMSSTIQTSRDALRGRRR